MNFRAAFRQARQLGLALKSPTGGIYKPDDDEYNDGVGLVDYLTGRWISYREAGDWRVLVPIIEIEHSDGKTQLMSVTDFEKNRNAVLGSVVRLREAAMTKLPAKKNPAAGWTLVRGPTPANRLTPNYFFETASHSGHEVDELEQALRSCGAQVERTPGRLWLLASTRARKNWDNWWEAPGAQPPAGMMARGWDVASPYWVNPKKSKAKKNGPTMQHPSYPFKEKEEQYRRYSASELKFALKDAIAARDANAKSSPVSEAWYQDDASTIASEIRRRG